MRIRKLFKKNRKEQAGIDGGLDDYAAPSADFVAEGRYHNSRSSNNSSRSQSQPFELPPTTRSFGKAQDSFMTERATIRDDKLATKLPAETHATPAANFSGDSRRVQDDGPGLSTKPAALKLESPSEKAPLAVTQVNPPFPESVVTGRNASMTSSLGEGAMFDDAPDVVKSYDKVPLLELTKLPRGGVSMETQAVGRVQVSMELGSVDYL